jgi:hypothetical protein
MKTEKERRIYYQDIVYSVCTALDYIDGKSPGVGIICGTADEPSAAVQERMERLVEEVAALRSANIKLSNTTKPERAEGEDDE